MKLKDIVSIAKNKKNKQLVLSLKKKKLKELGMCKEDILNTKLKKWRR